MFQGLRSNALIYILDKREIPKLKVGTVVTVSNPQPKYNNYGTFGQQQFNTFVDVTAKVDEEEINLKELPSNQGLTDCNGMVVTDNRDAMCQEVENMSRQSKMILDSVDYHNDVVAACESILREINPQIAKEKEQEEKISSLEGRITNIDNSMGEMMRMLSKALGTNNGSKK